MSKISTVYTDGSFLPQTKFAGSACFFQDHPTLSSEQYFPIKYGEPNAINAEIYAVILALAQSIKAHLLSVQIKLDCKNAIYLFSSIDYRKSFYIPSNIEKLLIKDNVSVSLLKWFWFLNQRVKVSFVHIYSHSISPCDVTTITNLKSNNKKPKIAISVFDFEYNELVDRQAKRAAHSNRYIQQKQEMDIKNPINQLSKIKMYEIRLRKTSWLAQCYGRRILTWEEEKICIEFWKILTLFKGKNLQTQINSLTKKQILELWPFPYFRLKLFQYADPCKPLFQQIK